MRNSGLDIIGDVPWGTHFCQFYEHQQDLVDTLVPYFAAGLAQNEFCMWVASAPLQADEAMAAMRAAVPALDECVARGQIEVPRLRQLVSRRRPLRRRPRAARLGGGTRGRDRARVRGPAPEREHVLARGGHLA